MVVGILGGGQLARMLALAGHPMGIRTLVLDPADDACAAPVASHLHGAFDDEALLDGTPGERGIAVPSQGSGPLTCQIVTSASMSGCPNARATEMR